MEYDDDAVRMDLALMLLKGQRHLAASVTARDSLQRAVQIAGLVLYVEDELAARHPEYHRFTRIEDVGALKALAVLAQLDMLLTHPDLLVLAVQRATDELERELIRPMID